MLEKRSSVAAIHRTGTFGANQSDPGVSVQEVAIDNFIQVAAWPQTIDAVKTKLAKSLGLKTALHPGLAAVKKGVMAAQIAPLRILVMGSDEHCADLQDQFSSDTAVIVDLSHSRTLVRLEGRDAATLLNRGLPLDLANMPVGAVASSAIHRVSLLVHVRAENSFDVYVTRAFASFFWEWIERGGLQFGLKIL